MTFYVNGIETPVIVDDYFPCEGQTIRSAHSKDKGEIWAPLLEKGWAKLHGSYELIRGGWADHASTHLSGLPAYRIRHKNIDADRLWQLMDEANCRDYTMHSSTYGKDEKVDPKGLVQGHMYSTIDCHEFESQG